MASRYPKSGRGRKFPPEPLNEDEVLRLIRGCSTRGPTGIRNRALLVVYYRAGLRCAEALALKPSDVDIRHRTIRILQGKGKKCRTVGIDGAALEIIERYIHLRRELLLNFGGAALARRAPLFCTLSKHRHGLPLNPSYVRLFIPRIAAKVGIDKRCHPHGLRHTHAYELTNERIPIHKIMAQLGHSSLQTTHAYVKHVAPGELIEDMQKRDWKGVRGTTKARPACHSDASTRAASPG